MLCRGGGGGWRSGPQYCGTCTRSMVGMLRLGATLWRRGSAGGATLGAGREKERGSLCCCRGDGDRWAVCVPGCFATLAGLDVAIAGGEWIRGTLVGQGNAGGDRALLGPFVACPFPCERVLVGGGVGGFFGLGSFGFALSRKSDGGHRGAVAAVHAAPATRCCRAHAQWANG